MKQQTGKAGRNEVEPSQNCEVCGTCMKKTSSGWYCSKCGTITDSFLPEAVRP